MPECDVTPLAKWVEPAAQGAKSVMMYLCPSCDTRRCNNCAQNVPSRTATKCPNGHGL